MTTQDTDAFTHVYSCSDEGLIPDLAFVCYIISPYRSHYSISLPSKNKGVFPKFNWIKRLELLGVLLLMFKTGIAIVM